MRNLVLRGVVTASLVLPTLSFAHGGTYRGPGDTTPPSGGGGGSGSAPVSPGNPAGPTPPGGSRPTPGGGTPGVPGNPNGGKSSISPGTGDAVDLAAWEIWWGFNKDAFLNLKSHILETVLTGSEGHYLGRGEHASARDALRVSEETIRGRIVPSLLQTLKRERSDDIQSSCMIALAKIGDVVSEDGRSSLVEAIREFLPSSSQELSETAAVALGILADRASLDVLTALLENDEKALRTLGVQQIGNVSVRTRAFAAYGLGLIGCRASLDDRLAINATLRGILDREGKTMAQRDIQVACLTSIGLSPLDTTESASDDPASAIVPRRLATRADQVRYLLAYSTDESLNSLIRAHAPTAMARLLASSSAVDDASLKVLVAQRMLSSFAKGSRDDAWIQQSCAQALGMIGDSDADPIDREIRATLMRVKEQVVDQQARYFALIALAQAAGRPGHGNGDPIEGVRCSDKRENARAFLLGELTKSKGLGHAWAGIALAILERSLDDAEQESSVDTKLALCSAREAARSPLEIGAFSIACGLARTRDAKDALLSDLEEIGDAEARGYTAVGLGLMDERSAIEPIQKIVQRSKYSPDLLKSAAVALGLLGDKALVPELVGMLDKAVGLASQAAISSALGTIGDARSVSPLLDLLEDQEVSALSRAFAAVALGIIADKEPLPWNAKLSVNSNYRASTPSMTDQKGGILDIL